QAAQAQTGPIQTGPDQPAASQGTLYVLPVGVSKYERPGNDLFWADRDAVDHDKFWRSQEGKLFPRVVSNPLTNRQATVGNIRKSMNDFLVQSRSGDWVIAPWSAHGSRDRDGGYLFCAHDGTITKAELRDWLMALTQKGVRVIL